MSSVWSTAGTGQPAGFHREQYCSGTTGGIRVPPRTVLYRYYRVTGAFPPRLFCPGFDYLWRNSGTVCLASGEKRVLANLHRCVPPRLLLPRFRLLMPPKDSQRTIAGDERRTHPSAGGPRAVITNGGGPNNARARPGQASETHDGVSNTRGRHKPYCEERRTGRHRHGENGLSTIDRSPLVYHPVRLVRLPSSERPGFPPRSASATGTPPLCRSVDGLRPRWVPERGRQCGGRLVRRYHRGELPRSSCDRLSDTVFQTEPSTHGPQRKGAPPSDWSTATPHGFTCGRSDMPARGALRFTRRVSSTVSSKLWVLSVAATP